MENQQNHSTTGQVVEVEGGAPDVSVSKGSKMIFIVASSVFAAIVFYVFLFSGAEEEITVQDPKSEAIILEEKAETISTTDLDIISDIDLSEEIPQPILIEGLDVPEVPDVPELPELEQEEVKIPELPKRETPPAPVIKQPAAPVIAPQQEKQSAVPEVERQEPIFQKEKVAISDLDSQRQQEQEESIIKKVQRKQALKDRRSTGIFIQGGGGDVSLLDEYRKNSGIISTSASEISSLELTEGTQTSMATRIADMSITLLQGKLIDAVLETAINTDLEGTLRGIVSRDVYAELGSEVLIPKGSRLIGSYTAGAAKGQSRILITWNRIIRPDGVDIRINNANSVDQFGRSGVAGDVDDKFRYALMNSTLISAIAIAGAKIEQEISDTVLTQTTSVDGGNTQIQGTATDYAIIDAISKLTDDVSDFFEDYYKTDPTITIPQGTKLKVFVNQDLVLPPAKNYASKVIIENK